MSDLLELAERVEAATEYDGRLMAEIDCAVFYKDLRPAEPDDHPSVRDRLFDPSRIWTKTGWLMSHNYWRDMNAAVALVPPGHDWSLHVDNGEAVAGCEPADPEGCSWACVHALTPALALTAAALRARAALTGEAVDE